jgi:NHLM bacteriocin system ABC transporter ATP-binding protein
MNPHDAPYGGHGPRPVPVRGLLALDEAKGGYLVAEGLLDVFAIEPGDEGRPGPRRYLFTAGPGDTLFCLPARDGETWRLAASGSPDCRAAALTWEEAAARGEYPGQAVDAWTTRLTEALTGRPALPAKTVVLTPGEPAGYQAGTRLAPGDAVVWARLKQGEAVYLDPGGEAGSALPGTFVPLAGRAWLSLTEDARVGAAATVELLGLGLLDEALAAFNGRLLDALRVRAARETQARRERLAAKARHDRLGVSLALAKIARVLLPDDKSVLPPPGTGDPLAAACRLVAEASRVSLEDKDVPPGPGGHARRLEALAVASGFRLRKVILEEGWFTRDCGPLVVFGSDGSAPAAALPRKPGRYELYDPATGAALRLDAAVASGLAPEAYMFYTPFPDRPMAGKDLLAFALRGQWRDLSLVALAGGLAALLALATPVMTEAIIGVVIPRADTGMLAQIAGLILTCVLASAAFDIAKGVTLLRIEGVTDARVQAAVTDRLLSLPVSFFKQYAAGDMASRCLGINAIHSILSGATLTSAMAAAFSLLNLALLFYYDWRLALVANAFVAANMAAIGLVGAWAVGKQRELTDLSGRQQGMELEYLTGIGKLRLTGAEPRAFAAWAEVFSRSQALGYQSGSAFNLLTAVNAAFPTLASMALFAWFFANRTEALGLGQFLSFFTAFAGFQTAMLSFVSVLANSLVVVPLYERARPILTAAPEADSGKTKPGKLQGDIEISHVSFRYQPEGRDVLSDLTLRLAPGEFVALAGDSGAGKSTVLRLLLGFETPRSGTIYYDGQDLAELDVRALRRRIGVVLQDDKPRAGSLFENIAGTANLNLDAAWEAARMAGLDKDIEEMPMGMQTLVPPGGAGFSGGQIQRLLIARALARRPKILFFDEATSALDNATQATVAASVASLTVTRLVIAHRLSTVMGADTIHAMRQGRVVESGTYAELMAKKGYFHELAKRQIA